MKKLIAILFLLPFSAVADPIEVAFSPKEGCTDLVVKTINSAQHSVELAAYNFTSIPIRDALINAHNHGVDVKIVVDKSEPTEKDEVGSALIQAGVPVRVDRKYHIMHNKFVIIDSDTVETGSFNFTFSAQNNNAENVIVLKNYPDVAAQYDTRFQRLWNESEVIAK